MKNILFKVKYPAEFHAQTALKAAIDLQPLVKNKFESIEKVIVQTHKSALSIIHKKGPLTRVADRDHCIEYIISIGLIYGTLNADHYLDHIAQNPLIDRLRDKIVLKEKKAFSLDYLDPEKRSIANSIQIVFKNHEKSEEITYEYPLGHPKLRKEALPFLKQKCDENLQKLDHKNKQRLLSFFEDIPSLKKMTLNEFFLLFKPT